MSGAPPAELMPVGEDAPSGMVRVEDFDSTLYFLDPGEVEYLQSELAREYATDHRRLVLASLLDIVEGQAILEARTEALATIDQLLIDFLSVGEFALVAYCLREAAATARRIAVEDECVPLLRGLSARLSEPSAMSQLLQAIDEVRNGKPAPGFAQAAIARQATGPDTVDGIAPHESWEAWWRDAAQGKREATPWLRAATPALNSQDLSA